MPAFELFEKRIKNLNKGKLQESILESSIDLKQSHIDLIEANKFLYFVDYLNEINMQFVYKLGLNYNSFDSMYYDIINKVIQYIETREIGFIYKILFESGVIVYDGCEYFDDYLKEWRKQMRGGLTSKLRYEILVRDDSTCQLCGAKPKGSTLHIDHILPISKGGNNNPDNLRVLCHDCNSGKSDSIIEKQNNDELPPFSVFKELLIELHKCEEYLPIDFTPNVTTSKIA